MAEETSRKVLRRTQAGIPARRASISRPAALRLAAVIIFVAVVAGFVLRPLVEGAIVLGYARSATGLHIDAGRVERIDGGYAFIDAVAATADGAATLRTPRADVTTNGPIARIVVAAPQLTFAPGSLRDDAVRQSRDALQRSGFGSDQLTFEVQSGSATILSSGSTPATQAFVDEIAGTVRYVRGEPHYDGSARLLDADISYPFTVHSDAAAGAAPAQHLTAPLLPLRLLAAFVPASNDLAVTGGTLRDVDVTSDPSLHATAHLENASFALGTHALHGVHGPLTFAANGAGSPGLSGSLDGVPFSASGEMHDFGPQLSFAQHGSNDFANLAALVRTLADEPRLSSLAVEAEAPGLAYAQYAMTTEHGPLAVSVLAIDPREPTLRFDTAIAEDHVISGGERTSAMGVRTGAVAGVNGDYFDIGRTYQPQGLLVRAGELVRGPVERAALAIDKDRHVTFGEFRLVGSVRAGGKSYPVTQFNDWPVGQATIITPAFGKNLPPDPGTTFARLEPARAGSVYRITALEAADTLLPVSFGVAFGSKLGVKLHVGEEVALSFRTEPSTAHAVAAIGGGPILVRAGLAYEDPHAPAPDERNYRWPVIALAQTGTGGLLLVAADGRHPERSVGMMRPEFAELLIRLGARDAMALDSGGSVTLVSRKVGDANVSVRNVPSDNSAERWISDALYLYSSAPQATIVPVSGAPTPAPEVRPSP